MLNTGDLQNIVYISYQHISIYFVFRQCHTPDEGNLDFHSIYTYSSCTFECKLKVYFNFNIWNQALTSFALGSRKADRLYSLVSPTEPNSSQHHV